MGRVAGGGQSAAESALCEPVGRTIFQKIGYVFTEQGVDTGFHFRQGSYGPFSAEVKEALSVFANANLIQEQQLGRMTALRIGPEYESVRDKFVDQFKPFEKKINKTVDLFSRIKSTAQAEEVTTVLYAARKLKKGSREESVSETDIYDYILDWKKDWKSEEKRAADCIGDTQSGDAGLAEATVQRLLADGRLLDRTRGGLG